MRKLFAAIILVLAPATAQAQAIRYYHRDAMAFATAAGMSDGGRLRPP